MLKLNSQQDERAHKIKQQHLSCPFLMSYKPEILHLPFSYKCIPSTQQIHSQKYKTFGLTIIKQSTLVYWPGFINLSNLRHSLGQLLELGHNYIQVYGSQSCSQKNIQQLNRKCIGVFTKQAIKNCLALKKQVYKQGCKLLQVTNNKLIVQIPHFTRYDFNFQSEDENYDKKKKTVRRNGQGHRESRRIGEELKSIYNSGNIGHSQSEQGFKFTVNASKRIKKKLINYIENGSNIKAENTSFFKNQGNKFTNNYQMELVNDILEKQRQKQQIQKTRMLEEWKNNSFSQFQTVSKCMNREMDTQVQEYYLNTNRRQIFIGSKVDAKLVKHQYGQILWIKKDNNKVNIIPKYVDLLLGIVNESQQNEYIYKLIMDPSTPQFMQKILSLMSIVSSTDLYFQFKSHSSQIRIQSINEPKKSHPHLQLQYLKNWLQWVLNKGSQMIIEHNQIQYFSELLTRNPSKLISQALGSMKFDEAQFLASIEDPVYRKQILDDQLNLCESLQMIKDEQKVRLGKNWLQSLGLVLWYFCKKSQKQLTRSVLQNYKQQIICNKLEYSILFSWAFTTPFMNISGDQPLHQLLIYWFCLNRLEIITNQKINKYSYKLLKMVCQKIYSYCMSNHNAHNSNMNSQQLKKNPYVLVLKFMDADIRVNPQYKHQIIEQVLYNDRLDREQYKNILFSLISKKYSHWLGYVYNLFINKYNFQIKGNFHRKKQQHLMSLQNYLLIPFKLRSNRITHYVKQILNNQNVITTYRIQDQTKLLSMLNNQPQYQLYANYLRLKLDLIAIDSFALKDIITLVTSDQINTTVAQRILITLGKHILYNPNIGNFLQNDLFIYSALEKLYQYDPIISKQLRLHLLCNKIK